MRRKMRLSRREFLGAAGAAAAFLVVPRHVVAASGRTPPSDKVNIAGIGVGGQGGGDVRGMAGGNNVVALADVDSKKAVIAGLSMQNNAEALIGIVRKESNFELKKRLVESLSNMPKNKAAQDYLAEIIR